MPLPVFLLAGPTGAGKTDWAIRLAESAPVEIISVDSALVYRGMDIGTAKPARTLRERIPHFLIDICEPTESYSAGRFVADALSGIAAIHARGRVPLLVGGTMLYFRALLHGLAPLPQASTERRREIDARGAREGWPALHGRLESRFDSMLAAGFLDEVRALRGRSDLHPGLPALRAVGYRQLWAHLDGAFGPAEARQRAITATRQLAKRQLTWIRSEQALKWLDPQSSVAEASWIRDVHAGLRELGL